jgi:hypothetical protein
MVLAVLATRMPLSSTFVSIGSRELAGPIAMKAYSFFPLFSSGRPGGHWRILRERSYSNLFRCIIPV